MVVVPSGVKDWARTVYVVVPSVPEFVVQYPASGALQKPPIRNRTRRSAAASMPVSGSWRGWIASRVAVSSSRVWNAMMAAPRGGQRISGLIRSAIRWARPRRSIEQAATIRASMPLLGSSMA